MEDKLGVRIDLRSDAVHVEGPDEGVLKSSASSGLRSLRRQASIPTTAS